MRSPGMANNTFASPECLEDRTTIAVNNALCICRTLFLLPPSVLILHHAHQHWRQQRSFASASHSDVFTYHLSVIELLSMLGYLFFICGSSVNLPTLSKFGYFVSSVTVYGELFFHVLTCVERYLAVVHPVIYQGLRNARGVKIRNFSVACVWLAIICSMCGDLGLNPILLMYKSSWYMLVCLVVILFCSLSVVCALIRPPPGDFSKHGEKLNQSRRRALYMMLVILGVLCLSLIGFLFGIFLARLLSDNFCLLMSGIAWLNIPSSLVLPLLYLHRRGRLS
ncbi:uncharacterized protein LOC128755761 [Synchiropus splendidus]|uniref:uncharacterized protein LOC128755761 n=1 Tax=Synchiropus splendidus TaxID=270530 RepID=UPI00237EE2E6|nr:uncharacterized protein LOC128755761 [Synchiropus splendidus]